MQQWYRKGASMRNNLSLAANTIEKTFDVLADLKCVESSEFRNMVFSEVVDTLGDYPRPTPKGGAPKEANPEAKSLAAYLYVSNARNTAKLFKCGCIDHETAETQVYECLVAAYSILEDLAQ